MKTIIAVGLGSCIGGILRFLLSQYVNLKGHNDFPFGTLIVNIIGCLLIGAVYGFVEKTIINDEWKVFFTVGILGGFTTFSAFSYEAILLIKQSNFYYALFYIMGSVGLGLAATYIGFSLSKLVHL